MRKRKLKTTKYGVLTADETIAVRDFVAGLSFVLIFLPYMTGTRVAAFACTHAHTARNLYLRPGVHISREPGCPDQVLYDGAKYLWVPIMKPNPCHPSGAQNFEWFIDFWKICAVLPWSLRVT